ncbi:MAG: hypothetical protein PF961_03120 [Planctomycetota bacterium]|jgi:hypothetical protein|nr:hypothetical protein [Planctomycetota bacterium]
MKPVIRPALRTSWLVFVGSVVVCALFLAFWSDWGAVAAEVETARTQYEDRLGSLNLAGQVAAQQNANAVLQKHIDELKAQTGVREVVPFTVPEDFTKPASEYFRVAYSRIRDDLLRLASLRGSQGYDQDLGFGFLQGGLPDPERVEQWLLMLQLTSKASYLALSAPHNTLHNIKVGDLGSAFEPVLTGPEERQALLREYRFDLQVEGSLHDILWLVHQLSAETQTEDHRKMQQWLSGRNGVADKVYQALYGEQTQAPGGDATVSPLVVLGLKIDSQNLEADQSVQTLSAHLQLAGMEFLTDEERGTTKAVAPARGVTASGQGVRANRP